MSWDATVRLGEISRSPVTVRLEADAARRTEIARALGLPGIPALTADLTVRAWLDGAELIGRFSAQVEQVCGISLDHFVQDVTGEIDIRVVPHGSPNAPQVSPDGEIELDPEEHDPPDVLETDVIDLGAYLIEHLALSVDPFPRKPGAVFSFGAGTEELSPFAALKALRDKPE